jgi:hypothetical protein
MKAPLLCLLLLLTIISYSQITLKDKFGRSLSGQTIQLVDWEGYMANPAIELTLQAPASANFPLNVTLSANGPRLYFDLPSTTGSSGPTKTITLSNVNPVSFYLSIFPDRDGINENYTLTLNSTYGQQTFAISVLDQDSPTPSINFPVVIDYSQDNPAYNFFADQAKRAIVRQAADDWAFFIQDMNFDQVPANNEWTYIWKDEGSNPPNYPVLNSSAYTGFLLYAYGIHTDTHHSGGAPSWNAFQTINGNATQLRRSGGFDAEVHGNYNTLGWDLTITDDTWYKATNFGDVKNDLYSIALHELGHVFCFNPGYPVFDNYKQSGSMSDPGVVAYQGSPVPIDASDHLSNGQVNDALKVVDRISKKGVFGSEYAAVIPYGRWLITKFNLLCLKAIGYNIKQTSAFIDPSITTATLPNGKMGQSYAAAVIAQGGIPFYKFEVVSGALPAGLNINSFSGAISGTPTQSGTASFTVRLTDYDDKTFSRDLSITVSNNVYTFTGDGDWNNAANWANGLVPPVPVPSGVEVVINPSSGGQCVYTGNFSLQPGAKLTLKSGKSFKVKQ